MTDFDHGTDDARRFAELCELCGEPAPAPVEDQHEDYAVLCPHCADQIIVGGAR